MIVSCFWAGVQCRCEAVAFVFAAGGLPARSLFLRVEDTRKQRGHKWAFPSSLLQIKLNGPSAKPSKTHTLWSNLVKETSKCSEARQTLKVCAKPISRQLQSVRTTRPADPPKYGRQGSLVNDVRLSRNFVLHYYYSI